MTILNWALRDMRSPAGAVSIAGLCWTRSLPETDAPGFRVLYHHNLLPPERWMLLSHSSALPFFPHEVEMTNVIHQTVRFNATPDALFSMYLDSKKHGAAIGDKVIISRKVGIPFTSFNGGVRGRNLAIVPNRMIVQSWRGSSWSKRDADSILILLFSKAGRGGQVELIQANVPGQHPYAYQKGLA